MKRKVNSFFDRFFSITEKPIFWIIFISVGSLVPVLSFLSRIPEKSGMGIADFWGCLAIFYIASSAIIFLLFFRYLFISDTSWLGSFVPIFIYICLWISLLKTKGNWRRFLVFFWILFFLLSFTACTLATQIRIGPIN